MTKTISSRKIEACSSGNYGLHARHAGAGRTLCGVIAYDLLEDGLGPQDVRIWGCKRCARSLDRLAAADLGTGR